MLSTMTPNTGCKKSKEERTDLMAVSEKPILTFTIDFETAKRYREANKMPHQFRRQRGRGGGL